MPLQLTASSSSAGRLARANRRVSASPFSSAKRKKPASTASPLKRQKDDTGPEFADRFFEAKLDDKGLLTHLESDLSFGNVMQQMRWVEEHQWSAIPDARAGMNSTRIAEVLNLRQKLPPVISQHHLHALSRNPTVTEREMGSLIQRGDVRRLALPPRDSGGAEVGELLVLVDNWQRWVCDRSDLSEEAKEKYVKLLREPSSSVVFTQQEVTALNKAGFLIGSGKMQSRAADYLKPSISGMQELQAVSTAGSQHVSGTVEAVGDGGKAHMSGGFGSSRRMAGGRPEASDNRSYNLTLPNIGLYLKLLGEAKAHLVWLLAKSNRYREMPSYLLKERWDGGIAGTDEVAKSKTLRGEWAGVLPGRTRKWKQFHGLEYQWVLEECLGAGLVECFRTGSVGLGVRALE